MKTKNLFSYILLICLCLSLLLLVGCDKLPEELTGIFDKNEEPAPHEHTLVKYEGLAPTCTEAGYTAYEICSSCDGYNTYTELEPLGHDFSDDFLPSGDHHSRFCSRCDETVDEAHSWNDGDIVVSPTCLTNGTVSYSCTVCKANKSESVDALGHNFDDEYTDMGEYHSLLCSRCDETIDEEHSWQAGELSVAPTCEKEGVRTDLCSECSATKDVGVEALTHDYSGDFVPNGDSHSIHCSRCDSTVDEAHTWKLTERVEANCTDAGSEEYVCEVCGATKHVDLEPLNHDVSENFIADGSYHSRVCSRCGEKFSTAMHTWEAGEILQPANCTFDGRQMYYCTACGVGEERVILKNGEHIDGGWKTVQMPTATVRGREQLICELCNQVIYEREIYCDADSMPVLNFTGDYTAATNQKNEVPMGVSFVHPDGTSFEGYAKIKVQGSSSVAYPKKNYTVKLYKDSEFESKNKVDLGWGKENKYVIKANWVDFSNARNVVSCRLWGDIVKSRNESDIQRRLAELKTNGGAIDGFPVAVYMNGIFHGIYTLNVPKDEWMFDMGDSQTEAILGADDWIHTCFNTTIDSFQEDATGDIISSDQGWELVYCGSDDYSWVAPSFNALITFVQNNDGEAFRAGIHEYLDVDAAIDYLIYMYAVLMRDNASKNMLWITFDGKVWTPSAYDQDGTFGQSWDGKNAASTSMALPYIKNGKLETGITFGNSYYILWDRLLNCFTEEILLRYKELRETTLSVDNIKAELKVIEDSIPESVYIADRERWKAGRESWWGNREGVWYEEFHFEYMYAWVEGRMANYDNAMRNIYNNFYLPNTDSPAL